MSRLAGGTAKVVARSARTGWSPRRVVGWVMAVEEIRARDVDEAARARQPGTVVVVAGARALVDLDLRLGNIKSLLGLRTGGDVLSAVARDVLDDLGLLRAQLAWGPSGVDVLAAPPPDARTSIDPIRVERLLRQLTQLYDYV